MSQVISGIRLGTAMTILFGGGDPNLSSAADVKAAGLNYMYLRTDGPDGNNWLYRCSTAATFVNGKLNSVAVWTAK